MLAADRYKIVVLAAGGINKVFTPKEFAGVRILPGMKIGVLDEMTRKPPMGLVANKVGKDLLIELPDYGLLAKLDRFDDIADLVFVWDISVPFSEKNSPSIYSSLANATSPSASDPVPGTETFAAPTKLPGTVVSSGTVIGGSGLPGIALGGGALALAAAAGGGGGGSGSGGGPSGGGSGPNGVTPPVTVSGVAVDGYLSGATVSRTDGSGNTVKTNPDGTFSGLTGSGSIKVTGGTDASTGQPFKGVLTAPAGASIITPVTTLIQKLSETSGNLDQAQKVVLSKLGIVSGFDVLKADPFKLAQSGDAAALQVFKAGTMVATALQVISGGDPQQFTSASQALVLALDAAPKTSATGANLIISLLENVAKAVVANPDAGDLAALGSTLSWIDGMQSASSEGLAEIAGAQANVLVETTPGYTPNTPTVTFKASVDTSSGVIALSQDSTARGPITLSVGADGATSFTRAGVKAALSIANFVADSANYMLDMPQGTALVVNFAATPSDDVMTLRADNASQITLGGDMGAGQDSVRILLSDDADNSRILKVSTASVSNLEQFVFDFDDAKDLVILTADSYLGNVGTIEVKKGTADLRQVEIPQGTVFVVNSGLTLTLNQLVSVDSVASVTGLGRLTIVLQSSNFNASGDLIGPSGIVLVRADGTLADTTNSGLALSLIGFGIGEVGYVEVQDSAGKALWNSDTSNGTPTGAGLVSKSVVAALQSLSAPSIPKLSKQVDKLEGDLATLSGDAKSLPTVLDSIAGLKSAIGLLNGLDTVSGSVSSSIKTAIGTQNTAASGQPSNATGIWKQIEIAVSSAVPSAVSGVQGQIDSIKSNAVTPLDSIAGLKSAIGVLNGLDSLSGSVSNTASAKIASAIGTPTTVVNNVTTNATGLWAQIETVLTSKLTELQSLLQTQVTTNTTDIGVLKAAVTELNAVSGATSVSAKIASAIGAKSTAAVGQPSNATGLWAQIETALNSAVTGVQGQIDSIKSNAVTPLDSIAGLKSALSDLTLLVSANDVKQTAALQSAQVALNNAIKVVGLTPVVSVLGGVLADGLLEASEGGLTVRVSLPLAAQANDSLQVSLNGTPLGLALSLSAAQINARFVDLPVSQSAIGAVGDKEISAQISSGN
ncbi:MAG: hypothetical protein EBR45_09610, partial [Betaproteobacteria bacterium]|nr:hypothetical protein [Betaproteobacteria bacterium]